MADVKVNLNLITDNFKKGMEDAKKSSTSFKDTVNKNFNFVGASFASMLGNIGADLFQGVTSGIKSTFDAAIRNSAEAQKSINDLEVSLRSAGLMSKETSEDLQAFADSIEATTIYSGEAVQATEGLLATLTTLDKEGIKKATQAAVDFAATMNISLEDASDKVTKAINGNTTAFQKMGIQIEKGTTDAENLDNVLNALASQAGNAASKINTFEASTTRLDNAKGKLLEKIGDLITKSPAVIKGIEGITQAFLDMADWVENNQQFLSDLGKTVVATAAVFGTAMLGIQASIIASTGGFTALAYAAGAAWAAITSPVTLVVAAIAAVGTGIYLLISNWDKVRLTILQADVQLYRFLANAMKYVSSGTAEYLNSVADGYQKQADALREVISLQEASQRGATMDFGAESDEQDKIRRERQKQDLEDLRTLNAEKIAAHIQYADQTLLNYDMHNVAMEEQTIAHEDAMANIYGIYSEERITALHEEQSRILNDKIANEQEQLRIILESETAKANALKDKTQKEKALTAANDKFQLESQKLTNKQLLEGAKLRNKQEEELARNRVANQRDTLSTIATLANSSNDKLAAIGKAAGLVQIAIDTPIAISKALAAFPPPFNFVAAGAVEAAMAVQAANLMGVKFAKGGVAADGPGTVKGSYATGDHIQALLNRDETVVSPQGASRILNALAQGRDVGLGGSGDNSEILDALYMITDAINRGQIIQIGDKEIISVVREGLASGRTI